MRLPLREWGHPPWENLSYPDKGLIVEGWCHPTATSCGGQRQTERPILPTPVLTPDHASLPALRDALSTFGLVIMENQKDGLHVAVQICGDLTTSTLNSVDQPVRSVDHVPTLASCTK